MAFRNAPSAIAQALAGHAYDEPTPVQAAVLEEEAEGRDLLVSAQTGSGKTVAYGLAIAETLLDGAETLGRAGEPLALIIAPTRELAMQVQRELNWLYQYAGARVVACVGGMDPGKERRQLADGVHIVVGTPGRLRDHLERRALKVSALKAVVLDEADEMLDLGFREDLQFILETTPAERRTLLFSATLPKAIVSMAQNYQRDALRIQTVGEARGHADIEYRAIRIAYNKTEAAVVNLLRFIDPPSALVFCSTRQSVRHLEATLRERGFAAVALSGELSQSERNHALQALRDGRARVCVATDVAARGIDLPNLGLVIHADLPNDAEVLQHRSGRTGRAGRKGVSILLVPPSRRYRAEEMLARARTAYTWGDPPSAEDIRRLDLERLLESPLLTGAEEAANEDDLAMAAAVLGAHSPAAITAAFVKMYRAQLPAPEEIAVYDERRQGERTERSGRDGKKRKERSDREGPARHEHVQRERDHVQVDSRALREPREPSRPARGMVNGVWFKITVGRERNADPKWLLPEICRQGEITKADIGAIRVFDTETRFEVSPDVADRFTTLVATRKKGGVRIFLAPDAPPTDTAADAPTQLAQPAAQRERKSERSHERSSDQPYDPLAQREERAPKAYRPRDTEAGKKPPFKKRFGDKPRSDTPYDASAPDHKAPDHKARNDKARDFKVRDGKAHEGKPYAAQAHPPKPQGARPGGGRPYEGKAHDGRKSEGKPYAAQGHTGKPREDRPGGKPSGGKPHGGKPFGKPFGKPAHKGFGGKKPGKPKPRA
ncbi:MAG TPA: DEAD/DEAH box helicase [Rhizomicrobium sp.]|nr:DEAD/DEAH box helicase [Rhizomicrobium sp.]